MNKKMKGLETAFETAKLCHKNICKDHEWVTAIGWDAMVTNEGKMVFFEGNYAGVRTPRSMFINYDNFKDFIYYFFWPYDQKYSI